MEDCHSDTLYDLYRLSVFNREVVNLCFQFNMDMDLMPEIFKKVFTDLKVNPREYLVRLLYNKIKLEMQFSPYLTGMRQLETSLRLVLDTFATKIIDINTILFTLQSH